MSFDKNMFQTAYNSLHQKEATTATTCSYDTDNDSMEEVESHDDEEHARIKEETMAILLSRDRNTAAKKRGRQNKLAQPRRGDILSWATHPPTHPPTTMLIIARDSQGRTDGNDIINP